MRVYELARELGLESKDVLARVIELGIDVKTASSGIADDDAALVRLSYEEEKAPPVVVPVAVVPVVAEAIAPPEVEKPSSKGKGKGRDWRRGRQSRRHRNLAAPSPCLRASRCRSCRTLFAVPSASSCENWLRGDAWPGPPSPCLPICSPLSVMPSVTTSPWSLPPPRSLSLKHRRCAPSGVRR